ncbi:MAG: carboxypeptidase-like regulatory domain-containing protein [Patescibacteria group bacterium]|nr:carboxypeptidase-like regulatory domain-containing protein [Patescibacteria group bacterium]
MRQRLRFVWFMMAVLVLVAAGCGGRKSNMPPLMPVEGLVTLDGRPLAEAGVQFHPVGDTRGRGAAANTDAEGRYSLISPDGSKGVPVGEYKVVISKLVMPDGSLYSAADGVAPMDSPAREAVPVRYSDFERSILTAEVPEGGRAIDFGLSTKR